jgi:hypothetical protein
MRGSVAPRPGGARGARRSRRRSGGRGCAERRTVGPRRPTVTPEDHPGVRHPPAQGVGDGRDHHVERWIPTPSPSYPTNLSGFPFPNLLPWDVAYSADGSRLAVAFDIYPVRRKPDADGSVVVVWDPTNVWTGSAAGGLGLHGRVEADASRRVLGGRGAAGEPWLACGRRGRSPASTSLTT